MGPQMSIIFFENMPHHSVAHSLSGVQLLSVSNLTTLACFNHDPAATDGVIQSYRFGKHRNWLLIHDGDWSARRPCVEFIDHFFLALPCFTLELGFPWRIFHCHVSLLKGT